MSDPCTVVGHVADVAGAMITIVLTSDEQSGPPTVTIGDEDIVVGRLGSYLKIQQGSNSVIAVVTRVTEHELLSPIQIEGYGEEPAKLPFAKRIAKLTPIGALNSEGEFVRGVGQYPTTGAQVCAMSSDEIARMFSKFQSKDYSVGVVSSAPDMRVYLDPTNLFGRHFAVLGQTGARKSWTVASLLQAATSTMPNSHIVILDLHGEYCWKQDDGELSFAFDDSVVRHIDARDLEIPYWLLTYAELCDLLIDHTDFSAHNQVAAFRDVLGRLRIAEGEKLGLDRTTLDTPVWFDIFELRGEIEALNGQVPGQRGPKNGPLTGKFDDFLMRLDSKLNDVRYDFLLKPSNRNHSDSLESLLRDFVGLGDPKRNITVIDLSSVPFDVRPTVAAQIGRLSFEFNYWNPEYRQFPLLLVCEEAHNYIPRSAKSQFAGSRKSMERIAKEGRKYGVGLAVVSQRPHEVSETVLSQCGTFLCLRITNPHDQNYVKSLVPESEGDLVSILSGLGRGEALILGEAVPIPSRVQIDLPNPTPNSDDVDFYSEWKDGVQDLDVAKIVDRWRSQER